MPQFWLPVHRYFIENTLAHAPSFWQENDLLPCRPVRFTGKAFTLGAPHLLWVTSTQSSSSSKQTRRPKTLLKMTLNNSLQLSPCKTTSPGTEVCAPRLSDMQWNHSHLNQQDPRVAAKNTQTSLPHPAPESRTPTEFGDRKVAPSLANVQQTRLTQCHRGRTRGLPELSRAGSLQVGCASFPRSLLLRAQGARS